jgi:LacI family transcriptional regulator
MKELSAREPQLTTLFASSDVYGLGAMRWAQDNGISVPEQLSIVGYDNIEFGRFSHTSLTTVRNDGATLAKAAVSRLMQLMEADPKLPEPTLNLLHGELIIGESTSRPGTLSWTNNESRESAGFQSR